MSESRGWLFFLGAHRTPPPRGYFFLGSSSLRSGVVEKSDIVLRTRSFVYCAVRRLWSVTGARAIREGSETRSTRSLRCSSGLNHRRWVEGRVVFFLRRLIAHRIVGTEHLSRCAPTLGRSLSRYDSPTPKGGGVFLHQV